MSVHLCALFLLIITVSVQSQTCSCICRSSSYYLGTSCSTSSSCASTCYYPIPHVPLITYVDVVIPNHALIIHPIVPLVIFTVVIIYYEI